MKKILLSLVLSIICATPAFADMAREKSLDTMMPALQELSDIIAHSTHVSSDMLLAQSRNALEWLADNSREFQNKVKEKTQIIKTYYYSCLVELAKNMNDQEIARYGEIMQELRQMLTKCGMDVGLAELTAAWQTMLAAEQARLRRILPENWKTEIGVFPNS